MTRWKNKKVVILGAGKSGIAAAIKLHQLGNEVILSEFKTIDENTKLLLSSKSIAFEDGGHKDETIEQADIIVTSPGIPLSAPPLQLAAKQDIPIISEIELAYQLTAIPCIAVTGSNGKTTTVSMIGALLKEAGYKAEICGNIGIPFIDLVDEELDYLVVEVSSYQLETIQTFSPFIALILNLYPNHLSRHKTMESYFEVKARIFENQSATDWAVINLDNEWTQKLAGLLIAQSANFSNGDSDGIRACIQQNSLSYYFQKKLTPVCSIEELPLKGKHNFENYLAMLVIASILNIKPEVIQQTIQSFRGVEHRLELVDIIQSRQFVNDSKATNYLATIKALDSFSESILLILGGEDKGGDFAPLLQSIKDKVRHVILLGDSSQDFSKKLYENGYNHCTIVKSMEAAVKLAFEQSHAKDVILLSPACASFDSYRNFEERGEDFKTHVENLALTI